MWRCKAKESVSYCIVVTASGSTHSAFKDLGNSTETDLIMAWVVTNPD